MIRACWAWRVPRLSLEPMSPFLRGTSRSSWPRPRADMGVEYAVKCLRQQIRLQSVVTKALRTYAKSLSGFERHQLQMFLRGAGGTLPLYPLGYPQGRFSTRALILSLAFLRGVPYRVVEPRSRMDKDPNYSLPLDVPAWSELLECVYRYAGRRSWSTEELARLGYPGGPAGRDFTNRDAMRSFLSKCLRQWLMA